MQKSETSGIPHQSLIEGPPATIIERASFLLRTADAMQINGLPVSKGSGDDLSQVTNMQDAFATLLS